MWKHCHRLWRFASMASRPAYWVDQALVAFRCPGRLLACVRAYRAAGSFDDRFSASVVGRVNVLLYRYLWLSGVRCASAPTST